MQSALSRRQPWYHQVICAWPVLCILLGVIVMCGLALFSSRAATVHLPVVLLASCSLLLVVTHDEQVVLLQKMLAVYLCCTVLDQARGAAWTLVVLERQIHVPACLAALAMFVLGGSALAIRRKTASGDMCPGWSMLMSLLVLHMAFAGVLLQVYYGLDWGDSLTTAGWVSACYLVSVGIWSSLDEPVWRRVLAALLGLYLAAGWLRGYDL